MDVKVGHGSLGKNKTRVSEAHPNLKGSVTVSHDIKAGEKLWLAAWTKKGDDGEPWISISISRGEVKPRTVAKPPVEMDDEIPF